MPSKERMMKIILVDDFGEVEDTLWTDSDADDVTKLIEDNLFSFISEEEYKEWVADRWDRVSPEQPDAKK
jgi:hypothetical protein